MRNLYYLPGKFKTRSNPEVLSFEDLPPWMCEDIYEIRSAWGVPISIIVREMAEDFLAAHWDLRHNKPKKLRWQKEDEKKPGSYTRRRRNKLLNGGYSNE